MISCCKDIVPWCGGIEKPCGRPTFYFPVYWFGMELLSRHSRWKACLLSMRRRPYAALLTSATVVLAVVFALIAASAAALEPPSPWDGVNPFNCVVQNAGFGTTVPDPGADPYCVSFDKTQQNITQLGMVQFLTKEPARAAAAVPKCFYFQEDHWRGSVIQSDQQTVIYEFIGHYFFNKATGDGGAWVTDFTVAGRTFDPTELPGFPPAYGQYFGPGTGGVISHDDVPADPSCVAQAKRDPGAIYAAAANPPRCVPAVGHIDSYGVGPLVLGLTEDRVRGELGPPGSVKRGFLHYCVSGGGSLLAGQPGDRSGTEGSGGSAPTVLLLTTSRGFVLSAGRRRTVTVASSLRALRRAFPHARRLARVGPDAVMKLSHGIVAGVRRGRVVYIAAYEPAAIRTRAALTSYLGRAG
jgi:hypothetical protein